MNLKEIEKTVGKIQTHLFKNSNSFAIGMLKSHFKGSGLQFKEHQVYTPGDDVRFIDWKLSAKTSNTFVKTFEEERNIEIIVVLDLSESMLIGYKGVSKLQASIEVACLLYLLAEKTKDHVKVVILGEKSSVLPLSAGQQGITLLISVLQKMGVLNDEGAVNLDFRLDSVMDETKKLALLKSFIARNKEVVLLSDFKLFNDYETLNKLMYRRNMHCFKVTSPVDEEKTSRFSIFTETAGKRRLVRAGRSRKESEEKLKGRFKKISVKERYLEEFVREML